MSTSYLEKALAAKRESKQIEFKESFDVASRQAWCEVIKDLVAIANSGGGIILFGVNSRGEATGANLAALRAVDPATIIDRVTPYVQSQFETLQIQEAQKSGELLVAWEVGGVAVPLVFAKPGTYPVGDGKQQSAFGQGTVYFRHGAKSEPGTTEDLTSALERRLKAIRREWLSGVRRVVHASAGSTIFALPPNVHQSDSPDAAPIRITDDPSAPPYHVVDADSTHPFRQKELMDVLRRQIGKTVNFNTFDIKALRNVHNIDARREFIHKPKFGSPQYSPTACRLDRVPSESRSGLFSENQS